MSSEKNFSIKPTKNRITISDNAIFVDIFVVKNLCIIYIILCELKNKHRKNIDNKTITDPQIEFKK